MKFYKIGIYMTYISNVSKKTCMHKHVNSNFSTFQSVGARALYNKTFFSVIRG